MCTAVAFFPRPCVLFAARQFAHRSFSFVLRARAGRAIGLLPRSLLRTGTVFHFFLRALAICPTLQTARAAEDRILLGHARAQCTMGSFEVAPGLGASFGVDAAEVSVDGYASATLPIAGIQIERSVPEKLCLSNEAPKPSKKINFYTATLTCGKVPRAWIRWCIRCGYSYCESSWPRDCVVRSVNSGERINMI